MDRFCMYLKQKEPLVTFKSGEHIFPAGIGGIQKLPIEYVSHEANNAFSAMEGHVMRKSLLALPRQFYGPGKRGNISNPTKATQSMVSLMNSETDPTKIEFGYVSLGKPYAISQIKVDAYGNPRFISDSSFGDVDQQLLNFFENLNDYSGKYTLIEHKEFSQDEFLIGYHQGKWYLGHNNKSVDIKIDHFIEKLTRKNKFEQSNPHSITDYLRVNQSLEFDDSYFRVCAKIIFNYLAFVKGRDFVLQDCFNPIRNWILNGGENIFANLTGKETSFSEIPFPDQAHKLFITQKENHLIGHISFYGKSFETVVNLSNNFEGRINLEGYICDWKHRKEYKFIEYLNLKLERE